MYDQGPSRMEETYSLNHFKTVIYTQKPEPYSCRLSKIYFQNMEYLWGFVKKTYVRFKTCPFYLLGPGLL